MEATRSTPSRALVAIASLALGCSADPSIDQLTQEAVVCARGATLPGIDVSYWQGTIDWDRVRGAGMRYAFIRAAYGANYRDPQFARNWREARRVGMLRGAYLWFKPLQDPTAQANVVVDMVGRLGAGDLPVAIDVEEPPMDGIPSPSVYASRLRTLYDRVRTGTGRAPVIYSGRYYWDGYLHTTAFNTAPLWHPQYTTATCPNINASWSNWAFWQHSSTGRVAGISGNVDLDRYNGTMTELNALAGIVPAMDAGAPRDAAADVVRDVAVDRAMDVTRDVTVDRAADVAARDVLDASDVVDASVTQDAPSEPADDAFEPEDVPGDVDLVEDVSAGDVVEEGAEVVSMDDQGGCGCRARGRARGGVMGAWALALVVARRRRRVSA